MKYQSPDLFQEIEEKRKEKRDRIRQEFIGLSDEQLETIVGNHIQNPIARTCTRIFRHVATKLSVLRYKGIEDREGELPVERLGRLGEGFYVGFNPNYVPTSEEYLIASKVLSQRREETLH